MPSNEESALIRAVEEGDANKMRNAHLALANSLERSGQNPPQPLSFYVSSYGK